MGQDVKRFPISFFILFEAKYESRLQRAFAGVEATATWDAIAALYTRDTQASVAGDVFREFRFCVGGIVGMWEMSLLCACSFLVIAERKTKTPTKRNGKFHLIELRKTKTQETRKKEKWKTNNNL